MRDNNVMRDISFAVFTDTMNCISLRHIMKNNYLNAFILNCIHLIVIEAYFNAYNIYFNFLTKINRKNMFCTSDQKIIVTTAEGCS